MLALEKTVAITGVGHSQLGRKLGRSGLDLTIEAALRAIADAGLDRRDIDGVVTWPGRSEPPGMGPVACMEVKEALGLELNWYFSGPEGPAQTSSLMMAVMAVATGVARHVLCFRTLTESTSQTPERRASVQGSGSARADGPYGYITPFKAFSAATWLALVAQRRFHEFGLTREQLAQIALNGRRNAALNPEAIMRQPLELDDYLAARMISEPLCLLDCDIPMDGSTCVIVSRLEEAKDLRRPPIRIEAMSGTIRGRADWVQYEDLTSMAARDAAAALWRRTDLTPKDVDTAQLYDGFSIITLVWLEALGFCGRGESGAFVESGQRISRNGQLPLNTHGGQLSAGRMHGFGLLEEACLQLWGDAGQRNLPRPPKVAVVANGGGPLASCLLLRRD